MNTNISFWQISFSDDVGTIDNSLRLQIKFERHEMGRPPIFVKKDEELIKELVNDDTRR